MKVIVGLALVALGSGCSLVRQHLVATAVGNHVYGQRLDELWPSAGKMLSDLGYSYTESAGAGGTRVLLSDWKGAFETSEMAATWTRVAVLGMPLPRGGCRIYFLSSTRTQGGNAVAYRQGGGMGMSTAEFAGLPTGMQVPLTSQVSGLKRAAAGPAMGGRNLRLEREFLARVDPETAQEIAEDVEDAITHRAPVSGAVAHAP